MQTKPILKKLKEEKKDGYTEITYRAEGKANIYGVLLEDIPYIRKPLQGYSNYIRVCIPDDYKGQAVIGPMFENDSEFDVTKLKAKGNCVYWYHRRCKGC